MSMPIAMSAFLSTPSARRATYLDVFCKSFLAFLSTPSARRATADVVKQRVDFLISIHALREEGDFLAHSTLPKLAIFLSTPSARRATTSCRSVMSSYWNFYPRPPRGGRPEQQTAMSYNSAISIHALREEGDDYRLVKLAKFDEFLSTPSARRATAA